MPFEGFFLVSVHKNKNFFQAQAQASAQISAFLSDYQPDRLSDDELKAALDEFVARFGRQTVAEMLLRTLKGYTDGPMKTALLMGLPVFS